MKGSLNMADNDVRGWRVLRIAAIQKELMDRDYLPEVRHALAAELSALLAVDIAEHLGDISRALHAEGADGRKGA